MVIASVYVIFIVRMGSAWLGIVLRTVTVLLFEVSSVVSVFGIVVVVLGTVGCIGVHQISTSLPVAILDGPLA